MFTNPVYVAVAIVTSSLMLLMLHHYGNFVENGKVVSFMGPINFSTRWDWESSPSSGSKRAGPGYHNAFLAVFVGNNDRCGRRHAAGHHGTAHSAGAAAGESCSGGAPRKLDLYLRIFAEDLLLLLCAA